MALWSESLYQQDSQVILSPGRLGVMSQNTQPIQIQREAHLPSIQIVNLKVGQSLYKIGDAVEGIYLLKSGVVKITSRNALIRGRTTSDDFIVRLIGPQEFFGYQDLVNSSFHQQEAKVIKASEVHIYPKELALKLLNSGTKLSFQIMNQMAHHLKADEEKAKYQYLASVGERIAHTLIQLGQKFGEKKIEGLSIQLKLTRGELAQLAGTINESLSRHLSDLKSAGIIDVKGKEIIIKDKEKLLLKSGQE